MTSNINPNSVDGTFPIANQDNSSQGFRDNFTNIKNNFLFAKSEISDLQAKAITTSALTGQTINNDLAGTQLIRPQLSAWTQSLADLGAISGTAVLDFSKANFQKITTAGPVTISLVNWPTSSGNGALGYGVMRIWIVVSDIAHTLTLPSSIDIAVTDIAGYDNLTNTIAFDVPGNYIFDVSSINNGTDYQIFDVTRNRASFRDPYFYYNNEVNSTLLIGYGPIGIYTALALEQGEDKVSVFGTYNSVAVGNLTIANISNTAIDNGNQLGGYTVTGSQGNVLTGTLTAVNPGDMIGYFNTLQYTGTLNSTSYPAGNTFQLGSSINFFATGSNITGGLGGNILFSTAREGGSGTQAIYPAMSVNNDQSVEMIGRFKTDNGIIESATYLVNLSAAGGSYTANANISTLLIDNSTTEGTAIAWANITLPAYPINGQTIKISAISPITNANINAPNLAAIKFIPTNTFSSGNTRVKLTYLSSTSTWYRS